MTNEAAGGGRVVRYTGPGRYVLRMILSIAAVGAVIFAFFEPLERAFSANPAINGLILAVLIFGVLYSFRQALVVGPSADWLKRYSGGRETGEPPTLVAPMASMLGETREGARLSAVSMRSVLDSLAARMAEAGEITRYFTRLLIFLGLLGTFWGLLQTISAIGDTVGALDASTGGAFDPAALIAAIREPLGGMDTAFSSSLFGLAGSLILGFLDLNASQAQNRFYNEVEEWLSSISRVSAASAGGGAEVGEGGASPYLTALMEQTADGLDALKASLDRADETRARNIEALSQLSAAIERLDTRLAGAAPSGGGQLDAGRLEALLERLIDDSATGRKETVRELRQEIQRLTKTIVAVQEERKPR